MKIDKGSSKGSTAKILLYVVVASVALLAFVVVAIPKLQNDPSKLPQLLQESTFNAIEDTQGNTPDDPDDLENAKSGETVISVESVTIPKGSDEVTLNIQVFNNPGIMGAIMKVSVDDQVFGFDT